MKNNPFVLLRIITLLLLLICGGRVFAQPSTLPMTPRRDTSKDKTNNGKWKNQEAVLTYEKLNSAHKYTPDSSIHTFHRRLFIQPWYRDMGNPGSPALNLLFTPDNHVGPTLGYHVFDIYRFNPDSLKFYHTDRPYSVFSYQASGRQENIANLMHTQNIKPNWNFSVDYRKITSPGYYKIQRNNHDNFAFTTNYKSLNKKYALYYGMVYNKEQHDENGGITNAPDLVDPRLFDRRTVNTTYQSQYSSTRSAVSNVQRDFTALLQHSYTWGNTDTLFDEEDTAGYTYTLTPRFSITHNTTISTEKHSYKDLAPDSMRYVSLFAKSFPNEGNGYYAAGNDSVFTRQKWFWADNKLLFNGFIGKQSSQLQFSAGGGIRYDQFISDPVSKLIPDSLPKGVYQIGYDRRSYASSYIEGQIRKEALTPAAWEYGASTRFYYTGAYAGNFILNTIIGKKLDKISGNFVAGFNQQLGSAPYSYTDYQNVYTNTSFSFSPESISTFFATLESTRIHLSGGARGYVINNYIYFSQQELPTQYTVPFTIPQVWLRKVFRVGNFYIDNEIVYQNVTDNTPVNVPKIMGRHQFSFEKSLFKNALKLATGAEVRYTSNYHPSGYNAQFNHFFYQGTDTIQNKPEVALFINFRIKQRFRAFITGENLQQMLYRNTILYTGTPIQNYNNSGLPITPVYAAPNAMLRFGFSWTMVN